MKGFVNIDKPSGITSSSVVVRVRKALSAEIGERVKAGHLGTLDPIGTGVLPVALGTAARLFDLLTDKRKTYLAYFDFGYTTDTLDNTGKITFSGGAIPAEAEIESVLGEFIGEYDQLPPAFSAKSVNGRRAYEYARKGEEIELSPKRVKIYDIKLANKTDKGYGFLIECGGGTYVRSLARDIAKRLGTYGLMTSIRRLCSGTFDIKEAVPLEEFEKDPIRYVLPTEYPLEALPDYRLPDNAKRAVLNGVKIKLDNMPQGLFKVYTEDEIAGIAENSDGFLRFITRL